MVFGNIVTVATIDKIGRRILLLISTLFICLSTAGVGAFFRLKEAEDPIVPQLGWLPLASFIIFIFVFSIGLGPVPWVLLVEFMPLESMVRIVAKLRRTVDNFPCVSTYMIRNNFPSGHCLLNRHQFWMVGYLWGGVCCPSGVTNPISCFYIFRTHGIIVYPSDWLPP